MPVTRSALARDGPPTAPDPCPRRGCSRSGASASACTRSTFSSSVPSFAWKTISLSAGALLASVCLRSWSQKNLASDSRARSTRSLPATMRWPPSAASMLATTPKRRREAAVSALEREIFLVRPHRRGQHLRRQVHEGGIDEAQQWDRPFDQTRDLVQQPGVRFHGEAAFLSQVGEAGFRSRCGARQGRA